MENDLSTMRYLLVATNEKDFLGQCHENIECNIPGTDRTIQAKTKLKMDGGTFYIKINDKGV